MNMQLKSSFAAMILLFFSATTWAADCSVNVTPVNFGNYDPLSNAQNRSGVATITVSCISTIPNGNEVVNYSLLISGGQSGNNLDRRMAGNNDTLSYNLFIDAALTQVWGDGVGASAIVNGTLSLTRTKPSATVTHTVYGNVSAGQNAGAGMRADLLTVTLIY